MREGERERESPLSSLWSRRLVLVKKKRKEGRKEGGVRGEREGETEKKSERELRIDLLTITIGSNERELRAVQH